MLKYFISNENETLVDAQIKAVLDEMTQVGVLSPEYPQLMEHLKDLNAIRVGEKRKPLSSDTIAYVVGAFVNTLLVVGYERTHVMTSKALQPIRTKP